MPKVTPFLWFDSEAEQAAELYVSLIPNSRVTGVTRFADARTGGASKVQVVSFELDGVPFQALNAGPMFTPNESFSMQVICEDQAEVDRLWDCLTANGGHESRCGWLKDRWGFSWQITPKALTRLLSSSDPAVAGRATQAMLTMGKIDIAALEAAAAV